MKYSASPINKKKRTPLFAILSLIVLAACSFYAKWLGSDIAGYSTLPTVDAIYDGCIIKIGQRRSMLTIRAPDKRYLLDEYVQEFWLMPLDADLSSANSLRLLTKNDKIMSIKTSNIRVNGRKVDLSDRSNNQIEAMGIKPIDEFTSTFEAKGANVYCYYGFFDGQKSIYLFQIVSPSFSSHREGLLPGRQ